MSYWIVLLTTILILFQYLIDKVASLYQWSVRYETFYFITEEQFWLIRLHHITEPIIKSRWNKTAVFTWYQKSIKLRVEKCNFEYFVVVIFRYVELIYRRWNLTLLRCNEQTYCKQITTRLYCKLSCVLDTRISTIENNESACQFVC